MFFQEWYVSLANNWLKFRQFIIKSYYEIVCNTNKIDDMVSVDFDSSMKTMVVYVFWTLN